jgi:NADH:ubiquinone oxidoreductase subunit 3 (subunit A)
MNVDFLTVIIIAFTVVLMWIGYVQILNSLIYKEYNLEKESDLEKDEQKRGKIQETINTAKRIQKFLIYQCLLFALVVVLSLIWLWRYSIMQQVDMLFIFVLGVFTFGQIIHIVAFWLSYKSRLCSK